MPYRPSITIIYLCPSTEPRKRCFICKTCPGWRSPDGRLVRRSSTSVGGSDIRMVILRISLCSCGLLAARLLQRRHHDQPDNADHQAALQRVVNLAVPLLDLAAG